MIDGCVIFIFRTNVITFSFGRMLKFLKCVHCCDIQILYPQTTFFLTLIKNLQAIMNSEFDTGELALVC